MENSEIDQVILAYLQGEATANEIEILTKWMSEHEDHRAIFDAVKHHWERSSLKVRSPDLDKAYARMKSKSYKPSPGRTIHLYQRQERFKTHRYKIAAAFIILLILAGTFFWIINSSHRKKETVIASEVTKENPKGQKLTTYLPDGSKVILNSLSKINYQVPFTGGERLIALEGEAFFEVKRDTLKPFRVVANGVITTALGTSFNVNSKNSELVEIGLVSGKVSVSKASNQSVILIPGKSAIVKENGEFEVADFDYLDVVGWKDGILTFKNNSLSEIINKLEDWYGVEFISDGKLVDDFHYTGNYKNESLEEVLQGISFVHYFKFKISGDTVNIYVNK